MAEVTSVEFIPWDAIGRIGREDGSATLVVFAGQDLIFAPATTALLSPVMERVKTAAAAARFKARESSALELFALDQIGFPRLLVIGTAPKSAAGQPRTSEPPAPAKTDFVLQGGYAAGKAGAGRICVAFDPPSPSEDPDGAAADFMLGARLRSYKFDLYKTKKQEDEDKDPPTRLAIALAKPATDDEKKIAANSVAEGVTIARDLVNEPANVLFPVEFAERAKTLTEVGVEVDIFDEPRMRQLGMNALLGVGQGSRRESRMAVMQWKGAADPNEKPLAFIGKGVSFDTGGISIKPAAGMEDMKGDMAGAACVVGLMRTLALRKARVNVVGAIGLVENMPDGNAQRPGDIVRSLSGQTIEIINTDAEGRLVLADVLWHVREAFAPRFMIDLATLTGAILVALGSDHAGLFSNDDDLAEKVIKAGLAVGEKVWRLPLGPVYDKMIESKFADMKNVGGRHAGSITAAQFLQRFVKDTPWVHLDIAGAGMASPQNEINQSWGSGWGVRLLDRLVKDYYES